MYCQTCFPVVFGMESINNAFTHTSIFLHILLGDFTTVSSYLSTEISSIQGMHISGFLAMPTKARILC
jgi:hypothetical protein